MYKHYIILIALLLLLNPLHATQSSFSKMATIKPELLQTGSAKPWCPSCGMGIKMFYKTSHSVKLKDGTYKQFCSIRCLAKEYDALKKEITDIFVTDVVSQKQIDAKKAFYVLGSKIKGTMSKVSKLAFFTQIDADAFAKENGGKVVNFAKAFTAAKDSLDKDIAMINMKKQKMVYPKGKKMYEKMCQEIDPTAFNTISELKAHIKNEHKCPKKLFGKKCQAIAVYLWDVKRAHAQTALHTHVTKDDKCPVCGMFVAHYPKWAAVIHYAYDEHKKYVAFDGVKDMMKFYLDPVKYGYKYIAQNIKSLQVTDYYSQHSIDAKTAYYVIGSDITGPMGNELIPFSTQSDAQTFLNDHLGKKVLHFNQIDAKVIETLER